MNNSPKDLFLNSLFGKSEAELEGREKKRQEILNRLETAPVNLHKDEIKKTMRENETVVLTGGTGSGKSTLGSMFLEEVVSEKGKIAVSEPRVIAAKELAKTVSLIKGKEVGDEVGYQVRFESRVSGNTRLNFMTDGILLQIIKNDPALSEYEAVMIDEAHERSVNIYFLLWLLKYRVPKEREKIGHPPLKTIIASATIEKQKFENYFTGVASFEAPGKLFPVETSYFKKKDIERYMKYDPRVRQYFFNYMKAAADKAEELFHKSEHTILIFMPGWAEIEKTIEYLKDKNFPNTEILALHSDLKNEEEMDKVFEIISKRKIVVSTNIAETSVTLPEAVDVIDSGSIKVMEYDAETGIEQLVLKKHSQAGLRQREGRAGRVEEGRCARLFTKEDFEDREKFLEPEIKRLNLAHIILTMKSMGINDSASLFEFLDPPKADKVISAVQELKNLGALGEVDEGQEEELTELGEKMAKFPLAPKFSKMLVEAEKFGCAGDMATIVSFLSNTKSVFVSPKDIPEETIYETRKQFVDEESDFIIFLNVWKSYFEQLLKNNYKELNNWAYKNFLNLCELRKIKDIRFSLLKILADQDIEAREVETTENIKKSIIASFSHNIMEADYTARGSYKRLRDNQKGIYIHPGSAIFQKMPQFFAAADIVKTRKNYARNCEEVQKKICMNFFRNFLGLF